MEDYLNSKQAPEIEQESGTPMQRIMSGSQWGGLCQVTQVEFSLTILKMKNRHIHHNWTQKCI